MSSRYTCKLFDDMMKMLKDRYDSENKKLDAEIQGIQNKLGPFWEMDIFRSSEEEMKRMNIIGS